MFTHTYTSSVHENCSCDYRYSRNDFLFSPHCRNWLQVKCQSATWDLCLLKFTAPPMLVMKSNFQMHPKIHGQCCPVNLRSVCRICLLLGSFFIFKKVIYNLPWTNKSPYLYRSAHCLGFTMNGRQLAVLKDTCGSVAVLKKGKELLCILMC